ncbi:MAG: choice-of-anchor J domain-containing protein [Flavobacteriaceae bacterium]|nr:choice-of-anchor J domain-containing protein [Flavobacteriaceae bacterium]
MKKITLLAAIFAVFTMNAQVFIDDFEDGDISDWILLDEDGDTFNFFPTAFDGNNAMSSQSWDTNAGPLTPNNYAISQEIDVTSITGLTLDYEVGGQDPLWSAEVYTIYVSTGSTIADFENTAITVSFNEDLGDDPLAAGAYVSRNLDVSALDGATSVYIAVRHHDVTDQFVINFDNISLDGILSVGDNAFQGFNYFIDSNSILNLSASTSLENVEIFNLLGQQVVSQKLSNTNETVNIASFETGIYIAKVSIDGQYKSFKFIKK